MKKFLAVSLLALFVIGMGISSCKSKGGNAVDKRIHKKRKKAGSLDCPLKDC